MGIVSRPASWMVNLELGVGKGPGELALFLKKLTVAIKSHIL